MYIVIDLGHEVDTHRKGNFKKEVLPLVWPVGMCVHTFLIAN